MEKEIKEFYTLEYSVIQNCFHISQLKNVLKINVRTSKEKIVNDYRIIEIAETYEKIKEYYEKYKKIIKNE